MKIGSLKFLMIAVFSVSMALPVFAEMPGEISLKDAPFTLDRAIETALANSRTLKQSFIDYDAAGQKVAETRAQFGFNLKATGNAQRVHDDTAFGLPLTSYDVAPIELANGDLIINPDPAAGGQPYYGITNPIPNITVKEFALNKEWQRGADVQLTKPLFLFGKKRDAILASRKQRDVKGLDVDLARLDLVASVKVMFFNFLLMKEVVKVQEEALRQAEAHLAAAKSRFEVGVAPKFDVIRANVEVTSAQEALTTAKKGLELTRMAFNNLLGLSVDRPTDVEAEGAYGLIALNALEYYVGLAMENRPEVKQITIGKELAKTGMRLSRMLPSVGFTGMWTPYSRGSGFGSEHTWRVIVGAEVPLFDNGLSRARVRQAGRAYDKLELTEIDLKEGITLQVKQAYLTVDEARRRLDSSKDVLAMADEAYRMADVGFKEGVTTSIDLLDAEHGLTQAKLNSAKADFDYEIALSQLALSCGLESLPEQN